MGQSTDKIVNPTKDNGITSEEPLFEKKKRKKSQVFKVAWYLLQSEFKEVFYWVTSYIPNKDNTNSALVQLNTSIP